MMAEKYTDAGTSLARGREESEAELLGGFSLGPLEMGFWSLRVVTLKSDLLATKEPWRLENGRCGWGIRHRGLNG